MADPFEGYHFHLDDLAFAQDQVTRRSLPRLRSPAYASQLRRELNHRALAYAKAHLHLHHETPAAILFGPTVSGAHGNFHPASYEAILTNPAWLPRLAKVHTHHRRYRTHATWAWRELDSASSSDALLMNIFCYPGVLNSPRTQALLGVPSNLSPDFGYHPHIPLLNGRFDRTEIDLRLGSLLVEAKLTESDFQTARPALIHRYRDLHEVFDLPDRPTIPSYQLLRGVLAAHAEPAIPAASFCVLADSRRPDLLEAWYAVIPTVRLHDLRCRLQILTWQELAATLPAALQTFLDEKYGILPA